MSSLLVPSMLRLTIRSFDNLLLGIITVFVVVGQQQSVENLYGFYNAFLALGNNDIVNTVWF